VFHIGGAFGPHYGFRRALHPVDLEAVQIPVVEAVTRPAVGEPHARSGVLVGEQIPVLGAPVDFGVFIGIVRIVSGPDAELVDEVMPAGRLDHGRIAFVEERVVEGAEIKRRIGSCLLEIAGAGAPGGVVPRLRQRGQQHGRENGDDGDDHQQFNQGKMLRFHEPCLSIC